ncbi:MAG: serine/threonine protein kinase [Myxococcales bacterium]|nr:serine/threonine protein kinase [Myxococcales bacterium]
MAESSPLAHSPTLKSAPDRDVPAAERLEPGAQVGEYVVERFLGAGAMGEVYAGAQPVIGKKVAIKVLKPEVAASKDGAERFKREARAVNQIDHPNVIDIFSLGRLDDGRLYLVMDLVEGKSLRKLLADGPLDVERALDILDQIASALDAAHARGVVHRDLKPDNVMVADTGKAYVLDFGLAKLLSPDDSVPPASMLTGQGTWLGTPGYMAPEQWSADGAGPASDRYSFGVMAFELLSGALPFSAPTLPQMMEQHFRAKVPALSSKGTLKTAAYDPIVARAMAKDPLARFPTGQAMVDELRAASGQRRGTPTAVDRGGSGKRWVPAVIGTGVLGLSVAAVLVVRGDRSGSSTGSDRPAVNPGGTVRIAIASQPPEAEVYQDGELVRRTPTQLQVPPGAQVDLELRKPGYAAAKHTVVAPAEDTALPVFALAPINGFEGVWKLPSKELRAFKRSGEKVEVSKLGAVDGPRQFFRHYELLPAEGGVAFGTTEDVVDQRAPYDPACHIPHKVEYQYDPQTDGLVVRRERVSVDFKDGHCVIVASELGTAEPLVRVDRGVTDARETLAPVGKPTFGAQDSMDNVLDQGQKDATAKDVKEPPVDDKRLDEIQKKLETTPKTAPPPSKQALPKPIEPKQAPTKKPVKQKAPPPGKLGGESASAPQNDPGDAVGNDAKNASQKFVPPPPQPQAPQNAAAPVNAPANVSKPRGDSQVAPQQAQFPPEQKK